MSRRRIRRKKEELHQQETHRSCNLSDMTLKSKMKSVPQKEQQAWSPMSPTTTITPMTTEEVCLRHVLNFSSRTRRRETKPRLLSLALHHFVVFLLFFSSCGLFSPLFFPSSSCFSLFDSPLILTSGSLFFSWSFFHCQERRVRMRGKGNTVKYMFKCLSSQRDWKKRRWSREGERKGILTRKLKYEYTLKRCSCRTCFPCSLSPVIVIVWVIQISSPLTLLCQDRGRDSVFREEGDRMDDTKKDRETVEQSRGQKQEEVQERKEKNSRGDFEEKEGREDREKWGTVMSPVLSLSRPLFSSFRVFLSLWA